MSAAAPLRGKHQVAARVALNRALKTRLRSWAPANPSAVSHVGALLAFTPAVVRDGGAMFFDFTDAATGRWAVGALGDTRTKLIDTSDGAARMFVFDAPNTLSRFGFRDENWQLGHTASDAKGIAIGAVHAGGSLSKHGLKITCPTSALLLTLLAVLARLDVVAAPTTDPLGVSVGPRVVPAVLNRLGLDDIADQYAQLVWPNGARP